jgi:hypothetical protein
MLASQKVDQVSECPMIAGPRRYARNLRSSLVTVECASWPGRPVSETCTRCTHAKQFCASQTQVMGSFSNLRQRLRLELV